MAVTKTDWSQPSSAPVNNPGSSASAQRYQAQADAIQQAAIQQAAADMYMTQAQAQDPDPYQAPIASIDRALAAIEASKARGAQSYALGAQQAVDLDRLRAAEQAKAEALAKGRRADMMRQSALAGFYPAGRDPGLPPIYPDTTGDMGVTSVAPAIAGSPFVDRYTGMQGTPYPSYLGTTLQEVGNLQNRGMLGSYMRGIVDEGRAFDPRFDMSMPEGYRLRGMMTTRDMFGIPVSTYTGLTDPTYIDPDDQPEVTSTVTNPATGREECPDGYTFDPDLNACRLDTRGGTMAAADTAPGVPTAPGSGFARMGLLDVAPEGLLEFQERYGAGFGEPSDFGAANLAFRQQAATYPEYFTTPPKMTGYTLLG